MLVRCKGNLCALWFFTNLIALVATPTSEIEEYYTNHGSKNGLIVGAVFALCSIKFQQPQTYAG